LRVYQIILCSVLSSDDEKKFAYLQEAVKLGEDVLREILKIHIVFCLKECRQFQHGYRSVAIAPLVENYLQDCRKLDDIENQIENSADMAISELKIIFDDVPKILEHWEGARRELDKEVLKALKAFFSQVWAAVIAMAIIAGITAIIRFFTG